MNQQLPNDMEVEKAVLGEILHGNQSSVECIDQLRSELFFNSSNATIFQVISNLYEQNQKVDMVTVASRMKDLQLIHKSGGHGYLESLLMCNSRFSPSQYIPILEEKFKLRSLIEIGNSAQARAYENMESSSILNSIQDSMFGLQAESKTGNQLDKASAEILRMIDLKKSGQRTFGLRTDVAPWDNNLGGLNPRFYVIAARAGKGKTSMAEQMIVQQLMDDNPTLIFEKDMSSELFILRMACRISKVPFYKYDLGYCSPKQYEDLEEAVNLIRKKPFHIYNPSNFTPSNLISIVKREKKLHGIKSVFLDHVLNLDVGKEYRTGLTLASTKIRESVEQNSIPHVILAQLNREAHNTERPTPAQIKEFDALYADCDAMVMLWSKVDVNEVPNNELLPVMFTCNKNRYGSEFEEELGFDRPLMTFKQMKKL